MARALTVHIKLKEPSLLLSTIRARVQEIEAITDDCYLCDSDLCPEHSRLLTELETDMTALCLGMVTLETDPE